MRTIVGLTDFLYLMLYLTIAVFIAQMKYKQPSEYSECGKTAPVKIYFLDSFFYFIFALVGIVIINGVAVVMKFFSKSSNDRSIWQDNS